MSSISRFLVALLVSVACARDILVYEDTSLATYWQSWSYGGTLNTASTTIAAKTGSNCLSFAFTDQYGGLYLHSTYAWAGVDYPALSFWLNAGSSAKNLNIVFANYSTNLGQYVSLNNFIVGGTSSAANTWVKVVIPFTDSRFGYPNLNTVMLQAFVIQPASAADLGTIYLDTINLAEITYASTVTASVDVNNVLRPISTDIYGVNFASAAQINANGYTVNRKGGDAETRYNFQVDVNNHAADYFFQNVPNDVANVANLPFGSSSDVFAQSTIGAGAKPLIQLTTIGWIANPVRQKEWSFSVAKYGQQQQTECSYNGYPTWCAADCGNGVRPDGSFITGNDPRDASTPANESYAVAYISHLQAAAGTNASYFVLDNECGLWHETHRDVHPNPITYNEIWNKILVYGKAIKAAFPAVKVFGPVSWNWCEYFYSPADGLCVVGPDFQANGNIGFTQFLLQKIGAYKTQNNVQLIDYYDIHYYPAENNVPLGSADDATTQALRLRSIRSLYDPYYTDESWLGQLSPSVQMNLLPRFRNLIAQYAPWLKFSITEYSWGPDSSLSAALAQVEVLALFAREGVDLATRWVVPNTGSIAEASFKLLINYDGTKTKYSGLAISANSSNFHTVPVYAAKNTVTNKLYVLVINKDPSATIPTTITINGVTSASGNLYQLSSTGVKSVGAASISSGKISFSASPYTASLFVFPFTQAATQATTATSSSTKATVATVATVASSSTSTTSTKATVATVGNQATSSSTSAAKVASTKLASSSTSAAKASTTKSTTTGRASTTAAVLSSSSTSLTAASTTTTGAANCALTIIQNPNPDTWSSKLSYQNSGTRAIVNFTFTLDQAVTQTYNLIAVNNPPNSWTVPSWIYQSLTTANSQSVGQCGWVTNGTLPYIKLTYLLCQ